MTRTELFKVLDKDSFQTDLIRLTDLLTDLKYDLQNTFVSDEEIEQKLEEMYNRASRLQSDLWFVRLEWRVG